MRLPQMKTLVNTAIGVAAAGTLSIIYVQMKQLEEISNSEYFKEAFKILRSHSGAVACLGQPIKQRGFRLSDSENFLSSEQAQFKVNVKGPLDKGKMHLWARPSEGGAWSVTRIELEVDKHPNKRLLVKDGPKFEQQQSQVQQQQPQQNQVQQLQQ